MIRHPGAGLCGTHRHYYMDCASFDALWKRARGRCEICKIKAGETPHGLLHIDHDYTVGRWGVRGLLCSRCNTSLLYTSVLDPKRVAAYVANPWWKHVLEVHGVPREGVPEPGIGAVVKVGHTLTYKRTERGWVHVSNVYNRRGTLEPWSIIATHFGPHRVRVVSDPARTAAA